MFILKPAQLDSIFKSFKKRGFSLIGPGIIDDAIMYGPLNSSSDLPVGVHDFQERGHYELKQGKGKSFFDYTLGPSSWKKYLFPPRKKLWNAKKNFKFHNDKEPGEKLAFIGIRPCELNASSRIIFYSSCKK